MANFGGGDDFRTPAQSTDQSTCDPTVDVWPLRFDPSVSPWVPFSYTHVEYLEGDLFGMVMAIASLLPIFIVVSFATLIIFRRDLHTMAFFAGTLLNEAVNFILKRGLGHLRPCTDRKHHGSKYAMPSNHSQFVWFFSVYLVLFLFVRLRMSIAAPKFHVFVWVWKTAVALGAVAAACIVSYSRAYLHYHSSQQVIFGSVLGAVLGVAWFFVVQNLLTPVFPVIASWRVSEFLLVRDTTLIPNVIFFEYTKEREETSSRLRKLRPANRSH
ncbi:putative Dolichyldiphosphatase 1 [Hypsibius exemplaris]|uniref:Dolichyldiphosphatase n=1 Tax=Hypsibius exemplaris TaxID=2072580 RepID=A0A9X6NJY7_HYPEX|nr:putative Dolichyldiphosphatase 1 [Hypsibius exemplaris]